jgi:hypothetical protein
MAASVPRHEALRELASTPSARAAIQAQAGPVPDNVSAWLAGLQTLAGVPFCYLVPDARMLKAESIRFFAVDPNWTAALADGALSLAAKTAPAAAAVQALRPAALPAATTAPPYSGFLLRSALVSAWPGLQVAGYSDAQGTNALALARLDRPAPTVLLALFAGLVQRVELTEPAQHLHFGVSTAENPQVALRLIDGTQAGKQPDGDPAAPVSFRQDPGRQVIDVTATIATVKQRLAQVYGSQAVPPIGSAALSLQLVQLTTRQPFTVNAPKPGTAAAPAEAAQ